MDSPHSIAHTTHLPEAELDTPETPPQTVIWGSSTGYLSSYRTAQGNAAYPFGVNSLLNMLPREVIRDNILAPYFSGKELAVASQSSSLLNRLVYEAPTCVKAKLESLLDRVIRDTHGQENEFKGDVLKYLMALHWECFQDLDRLIQMLEDEPDPLYKSDLSKELYTQYAPSTAASQPAAQVLRTHNAQVVFYNDLEAQVTDQLSKTKTHEKALAVIKHFCRAISQMTGGPSTLESRKGKAYSTLLVAYTKHAFQQAETLETEQAVFKTANAIISRITHKIWKGAAHHKLMHALFTHEFRKANTPKEVQAVLDSASIEIEKKKNSATKNRLYVNLVKAFTATVLKREQKIQEKKAAVEIIYPIINKIKGGHQQKEALKAVALKLIKYGFKIVITDEDIDTLINLTNSIFQKMNECFSPLCLPEQASPMISVQWELEKMQNAYKLRKAKNLEELEAAFKARLVSIEALEEDVLKTNSLDHLDNQYAIHCCKCLLIAYQVPKMIACLNLEAEKQEELKRLFYKPQV
tara:strand:- start:76039 stop:77610 length:1572 start_codon:yes stop_codon:yes gene_type:complete